jgi:hypothetical protein
MVALLELIQHTDACKVILEFLGHRGSCSLGLTCVQLRQSIGTQNIFRIFALNTLKIVGTEERTILSEDLIDWRNVSEIVHFVWLNLKIYEGVWSVDQTTESADEEVMTTLLEGNNGTSSYENPEKDHVVKESVSRLCRQLMSLLNDVTHDSKDHPVHCGGTFDEDPRLFVPSIGEYLELPIKPALLRRLIDEGICEQAPLGVGSETVVDTSLRRCWRMELGKQALVSNPAFQALFTSSSLSSESPMYAVKEAMVPHLFGVGEVIVQPYQLLIYEEGGMFKPHRDTLRGRDCFGSCVVSLPVQGEVEGGDLVLTFQRVTGDLDEPEVVVCSSPKSSETPKWHAFFTDVLHEVQPVTKGYRVTMTFHLWAAQSSPDIIPRPVKKKKNDKMVEMLIMVLGRVIQQWVTVNGMQQWVRFVLSLEHMYSHVSLKNLRGYDRDLYDCLCNAFKGTDMEVHVKTC